MSMLLRAGLWCDGFSPKSPRRVLYSNICIRITSANSRVAEVLSMHAQGRRELSDSITLGKYDSRSKLRLTREVIKGGQCATRQRMLHQIDTEPVKMSQLLPQFLNLASHTPNE
jgi:hypothetical protein